MVALALSASSIRPMTLLLLHGPAGRPAAAGALPGLGPRPVHRGEPGPHPGLRGHRSACRMNVATATGLAMNAVCEPSMASVVAPIRCAMNRSASGEIALSCSETRNQDGLLFQPAAVAFSLSAAAASGRWVANMT